MNQTQGSKAADIEAPVDFVDFEKRMNDFTTYSTDAQLKTFTINTVVRNSEFFFSTKFNETSSGVNSSITLTFYYEPACDDNLIGSPYNGCQNYTALPQDGSTLTVNVTGMALYRFTIPEGSCTSSIVSTFPKAGSNVKVYLSRLNAPTSKYYDYSIPKSSGAGGSSFGFNQPIPGDWYALVVLPGTTPTIGGLLFTSESRSCNLNKTDLTGNHNLTQISVNASGFQYYVINSQELMFGVSSVDGESNAPAVTVSHFNYPGNDSYFLSAKGNTTNFLWAMAEADQTFQWRIAVWGQEGQDYYVWAGVNCPNQCQGDDFLQSGESHGTCLKDLGVCQCESGYHELACFKKSKVVMIVLVIIAVVVIVGIGIAAWYFRNKRRQQKDTLYL
jgi:heme/copper-type cytochrome/quinol oxidase subunit 2